MLAVGGRALAGEARSKNIRKPYGEQRSFSASSLPKASQIDVTGKNFIDIPGIVPPEVSSASITFSASAGGAVSAASASEIEPYLRSNSPLVESANLVSGGPFANLSPAIRLRNHLYAD
ncbi:MAG: hypothetical protein M0D55_01140 [Elusimicrobiota bacterium]|nr:MAG: hypothetical protein M0D55_01140 [Elusimicrobiota bacterium]